MNFCPSQWRAETKPTGGQTFALECNYLLGLLAQCINVYSPSHFSLGPTLPFPEIPTSRRVLRSQCTSVWEVLQASVVSRHLHRANSQCGSPTVRTCIISTMQH